MFEDNLIFDITLTLSNFYRQVWVPLQSLNLSEEIKIIGYNGRDTCNNLCVKINIMTVELCEKS